VCAASRFSLVNYVGELPYVCKEVLPRPGTAGAQAVAVIKKHSCAESGMRIAPALTIRNRLARSGG